MGGGGAGGAGTPLSRILAPSNIGSQFSSFSSQLVSLGSSIAVISYTFDNLDVAIVSFRDISGGEYLKDDKIKLKLTLNTQNINGHEIFIKLHGHSKIHPNVDKLHILINPPYDKRISTDANELYKKIGDTLKNNYLFSDVWLISANLEAIKSIGLRSNKKIKLFNSNLESRLLNYNIYPGSKKNRA